MKITLADTPLLDQDGRKLRLRTDVMAGRVVVVDFIYTTCTTICPIFTATMASVQERLADVVGRDVQLITMTVDPAARHAAPAEGVRAASTTPGSTAGRS